MSLDRISAAAVDGCFPDCAAVGQCPERGFPIPHEDLAAAAVLLTGPRIAAEAHNVADLRTGPHGVYQGALPIGHPPTGRHVREFVPERGDAPLGQGARGRFHERVPHSRARAVREQEQRRGHRGSKEKAADGGVAHLDLEFGCMEETSRRVHPTGVRSSAGPSDQAPPSQCTGRTVVRDSPISNHQAASRPSIVALPPQNRSGGIAYRNAW